MGFPFWLGAVILPIKPHWAFALVLPLLLGRYRFFYPIAGRRRAGLSDRGRDDRPGWRRGIWDPAVPGLLRVSFPPD